MLKSKRLGNDGFTLIELLIVIAIILILVAIALPNFLEAQVRARVARVKGELRTLATAMEAYHIDWKLYPSFSFPNLHTIVGDRRVAGLAWLTSPIAYITALPEDPFPGDQGPGGHRIGGPQHPGPYYYILDGVQTPQLEMLHPDGPGAGFLKAWAIYSLGPDTPEAEVRADSNANPVCNNGDPVFSYTPTNGTKSKGDILKYGGDPRWMGVEVDSCLFAWENRYYGKGTAANAMFPRPGQRVNDEIYLGRFPGNL